MLLSSNKKNNVYPCKPQFYYIKVGLGVGSKLYRHVFRVMVRSDVSAKLFLNNMYVFPSFVSVSGSGTGTGTGTGGTGTGTTGTGPSGTGTLPGTGTGGTGTGTSGTGITGTGK